MAGLGRTLRATAGTDMPKREFCKNIKALLWGYAAGAIALLFVFAV